MVEPINLNKARKAKARTEASARASENRVRFGRGKAERAAEKLAADLAARQLDQHKRED